MASCPASSVAHAPILVKEACVRNDIDEPLAIRLLKRSAADEELACGGGSLRTSAVQKDAKIAIIGAGPAGLAADLPAQGQGIWRDSIRCVCRAAEVWLQWEFLNTGFPRIF